MSQLEGEELRSEFLALRFFSEPTTTETTMQPNDNAMLCYVDLEALVIVCTDAASMLNGAELLDLEPTEDQDLVSATYKNPSDGMPVTEILPMLPPLTDDPQWKKDGHCCESCASGHECDGDACSAGPSEALVGSSMGSISIPKHRSVRNPNRRPRIFSRRK